MNQHSRAAKILQLSLAQNKCNQPTPVKTRIDLPADTIEDVVENILLNDTDNIGIDVEVFDNISSIELDSTMPLQPLLTSSPLSKRIPAAKISSTSAPAETSASATGASETEADLPTKAAAPEKETPTVTTAGISLEQEGEEVLSRPTEQESEREIEEENIKMSSKKERGPCQWRQNIMKRRRELGQDYTMRNGGVAPAKSMAARCECKSKGKECSLISEEDRRLTFQHIWKLSWGEKRNFIYGLVDQDTVGRKRSVNGEKKRDVTFRYHLKTKDQRKPVCLKMFLNTTGLTKHFVMSMFDTKNDDDSANDSAQAESSQLFSEPKKSRSNPHYKRGKESHELLLRFFDELPKMPSHYCRKTSTKLYLEPDFKSLVEVHKAYEQYSQKHQAAPLKLTVFKQVFHQHNLSLFKPKKDRCDLCMGYEAGNIAETEWQDHMKFKEEALKEKEHDKTRAKDSFKNGDKKVAAFCMDLESVLLAPKTEAGAMYFKTKLAVHNFTVYNLAHGAVSCYVWNETEGGLTASEFSSCIRHYLGSLEKHDEIIIYSNGCTYQNRNAVLANTLQQFATSTGTTIVHKYLVRGHTHMEVDKSHSLIERARKGRTINVPYDYVEVMKSARKSPSPFTVHYVMHDFFMDFSQIGPYTSIRPGKKTGEPTVTDVHCFKYTPEDNKGRVPIQYKLRFSDAWQDIPVPRDFLSKTVGEPKQLYQERLKITKTKYDHLQALKAVIGKDYHPFYDQLPYK